MTADDTPVVTGALPHLAGYIEQLGIPETKEAAIQERDLWVESAAQFSRNEDYYRGLLDQCAAHLGHAAFVADDGSVSDSPIRAKIPELVAALVQAPSQATGAGCIDWDAIRSAVAKAAWPKAGLVEEAMEGIRKAISTAPEAPQAPSVDFARVFSVLSAIIAREGPEEARTVNGKVMPPLPNGDMISVRCTMGELRQIRKALAATPAPSSLQGEGE